MNPRVEKALAALFPEGIPPARLELATRAAAVLESLLEGEPAPASPALTPDAKTPNTPFMAALRQGATTEELAKSERLSEQAVRTRISRLTSRGYKIETRSAGTGNVGRPMKYYRLLSVPK